jgi:hypothetical protein
MSAQPNRTHKMLKQKLRLSDDLTTKLGARYCSEKQLVALLLSHDLCSRVSTFEVKATLMTDMNEWMTITLDGEHASTADVKEGVEREKGISPAMQELFFYDKRWTRKKNMECSGYGVAQEKTAFVEEGFVFEDRCSLMVSVNELYDLVLEGQEKGEPCHSHMGTYVRVKDLKKNGRGVWRLKSIEAYLWYSKEGWFVSGRDEMDSGWARGVVRARSSASTPDRITERWQVFNMNTRNFVDTPKLCARVWCYGRSDGKTQEAGSNVGYKGATKTQRRERSSNVDTVALVIASNESGSRRRTRYAAQDCYESAGQRGQDCQRIPLRPRVDGNLRASGATQRRRSCAAARKAALRPVLSRSVFRSNNPQPSNERAGRTERVIQL